MEKDRLLDHLKALGTRTDEEWMLSLTQRKRDELDFHDQHRQRDQATCSQPETRSGHENERFYSVVDLSRKYLSGWLGEHVPGRIVLDYACGDGKTTIAAAHQGALLAIGIDISRTSVDNATVDAAQAGVENRTCFLQADCENTLLPDECVDVIICSGMLHHLDLKCAFPELRRILKPGGVVIAYESLAYNPFIWLYRELTPKMRTDWEKRHILTLNDLDYAKQFFRVRNVLYWHLFVIPAALLHRTRLFGPLVRLGNALDTIAMKIPLVKLLAWEFTFELHKPLDP